MHLGFKREQIVMNCDSVQQQLSSFFDGELSELSALEVHTHIQTCPACQAELESFKKLRLTIAVSDWEAEPPPWSAIQTAFPARNRSLSLAREDRVTVNQDRKSSRWFNDVLVIAAAMAASILIFIWTVHRSSVSSQVAQRESSRSVLIAAAEPPPHTQHESSITHDHRTHEHNGEGRQLSAVVDLNETLKLNSSGTEAAMQDLASRYNGKAASLTEVVRSFGHQPSVQSILPSSVKLVSAHLLEMPQCNCSDGVCTCGPGKCNCVAAVCQRPDGSTFLVVEQCRGQDVSFGDAPTRIVKRGNRELMIGKNGDAFAVNWKASGGRLTAFGLQSLDELDQMLAMK